MVGHHSGWDHPNTQRRVAPPRPQGSGAREGGGGGGPKNRRAMIAACTTAGPCIRTRRLLMTSDSAFRSQPFCICHVGQTAGKAETADWAQRQGNGKGGHGADLASMVKSSMYNTSGASGTRAQAHGVYCRLNSLKGNAAAQYALP